MAHHKFRIGQLVDFAPSRSGVPTSGRQYQILRLMPANAGELQSESNPSPSPSSALPRRASFATGHSPRRSVGV